MASNPRHAPTSLKQGTQVSLGFLFLSRCSSDSIGVNRSSSSEFAGLVFSPSGKTLFVNIQESGETIAIRGPWSALG